MSIVRVAVASLITVLVGFQAANAPHSARASKLHLEEIGSDSTSFDVVSTLIVGPTEALLWDGQYHLADARRMADKIAASGKHLKAIVISHPDHDHFSGTAAIVERFPGTPVYMTPAALAIYTATGARGFQAEKSRNAAALPDSLVTIKPLPSLHLTVDGEDVEVVPDLTGDSPTPVNSFLWIPSLRAVLASDIAFNGVHPWMGTSTDANRADWHLSLKRIADLHPTTVVAGHKKDISAPDSPDVLKFMDQYLTDFDTFKKTTPDAKALYSAMLQKYPDLAVPRLLAASAYAAFR
jgi:glyoxylase-like metal-dependent hydrolase (beta-lactamase superfamily II)